MSFRPPIRESVGAGLPEMEGLAKAELPARQAARRELVAAGERHWPRLHVGLARLGALRGPGREVPTSGAVPIEDEIEKELGRKLDAAEREMARYLGGRMSAEEVAEAIKEAGR